MPNTRTNPSPPDSVDRRWRGLYLLSGLVVILTAALSLVAAWGARTLYSPAYPTDAASYLQLVSQHQGLATFTWSLWILMDLLGLAPTVAMYILLQRHNRILALIGSLLVLFYAIYDVSATELNSLALVGLSQGYLNASSDAGRASFVAAAAYGYQILPYQTVLSFGIGSLGYLFWCAPMARSFFGRWTALFGVIVNVMGLLGSAASVVPSFILGLFQFICVRAIALWFILVGVQMIRYARRIPAEGRNTPPPPSFTPSGGGRRES